MTVLASPRDLLLLTGEILGRNRPAKPPARLPSPPIRRNGRTKIFGNAEALCQQQRISDGNVGGGESAGTQHVTSSDRGLHTAQPAEEPFGVIGRHLRIA